MIPQRVLLAAVTVLSIDLAFCFSPASAHSWYPKDCCSNRDCMRADSVTVDARGNMIVTVGRNTIPIPGTLRVRSSPDGHPHICFRIVAPETGEDSFPLPLCLFQPPES